MGPFTIGGGWLVNLLIGVGFGFALESSGFGDARKIAGQFYFKELTVLKVMFTAIIVAAVLVFGASALGFLDYQAVYVNETHLWPGVVGGLIMGVGFVVGGYCPGTSLVSAGTGKLDGMLFVGGVAFGSFLFGDTVGAFEGWWNADAAGRLTLQELLGVDAGVVVLGLVSVAIFAFWGAEKLRAKLGGEVAKAPRWQLGAAGALGAAALVVALVGQPDVDARWEMLASKYGPRLENREVQIDPQELLGLMHDDLVSLSIVDVRDETSWNLFHLQDAQRVAADAIEAHAASFRKLPVNSVVVLVDNDETLATEAWKKVMALSAPNVYVLAGGLNAWLERFGHEGHGAACETASLGGKGDPLRHVFPAALGARHAAADPDPHHVAQREFEQKVQLAVQKKKAGGCG